MPALLPILLAHCAALFLFWYAPRFWAARDAKAFNVNPTSDTFHQTFHRQRLSWRVAALVVIAALASEPFAPYWLAACLSFLGLVSIGAAYFFFDFNPRLNRARNLPYVGEYYVSPSPTAARFPDRWLWARAQARWPRPGTMDLDKLDRIWQDTASRYLRDLGQWVLETGALLYAAFILGMILCVQP